MAPIPTLEKPPADCTGAWVPVWKALVVEMKAIGTWKPALWPHAVQYLHVLRLADEHRVLAEVEPVDLDRESGLAHMHAAFQSSLAHGKRATELADLLGVTPKAQKALLANMPEAPAKEPSIVGHLDQLSRQRQRRATA